MANRMWTPNISGKRPTIVARWDPFTFAGELVVNGRIVKSWGGPRLAKPDITFEIEGHDAFLRNNLRAWDLYLDGEKVPHKQTEP
jgi:hypothetical protein